MRPCSGKNLYDNKSRGETFASPRDYCVLDKSFEMCYNIQVKQRTERILFLCIFLTPL